MAEVRKEQVTQTKKVDIQTIVTMHIANVMGDPTKMRALEMDIDAYLADLKLSPATVGEFRQDVTKQLTRGRQAMESVLHRILMTIG